MKVVGGFEAGHICVRKMVLLPAERMEWDGLRFESAKPVRWMSY